MTKKDFRTISESNIIDEFLKKQDQGSEPLNFNPVDYHNRLNDYDVQFFEYDGILIDFDNVSYITLNQDSLRSLGDKGTNDSEIVITMNNNVSPIALGNFSIRRNIKQVHLDITTKYKKYKIQCTKRREKALSSSDLHEEFERTILSKTSKKADAIISSFDRDSQKMIEVFEAQALTYTKIMNAYVKSNSEDIRQIQSNNETILRGLFEERTSIDFEMFTQQFENMRRLSTEVESSLLKLKNIVED